MLKRHDQRGVQLWVTGSGAAIKSPEEQRARVVTEAARLRPIAAEAAKLEGTVALYNHGAWFGEPENQLEIIAHLRAAGITNVGLVYNLHHGHDHVARFPALLAEMKPHLLALNLNGTVPGGDKAGQKIVPLAQGELDASLLTVIRDSGWRGPIGILNHTDEDAEGRLRDNLAGLDWLRQKNIRPTRRPTASPADVARAGPEVIGPRGERATVGPRGERAPVGPRVERATPAIGRVYKNADKKGRSRDRPRFGPSALSCAVAVPIAPHGSARMNKSL